MVRESFSMALAALLIGGCAGGATSDEDRGPDAVVVTTPPATEPGTQPGAQPSANGNTGAGITDPTLTGQAGGASPVPSDTPGTTPPPPGQPAGDPLPGDPTMPPVTVPPETPPMDLPPGTSEPTIPPVTADCPAFRNGTINFMGLGGIQVVSGTKPAGPTGPMVFYWHGTGGLAGEFAFQAGAVRDGVVAEGGVLISFQGTTGGDLLSGTFIFGASDFELVDQLVACAVRDHNVDPRRIYATGCSAGGLFSAAMAAERSSYVAAVAPNSGGWTVPVVFQNDYTPALMTVHGAPGVDVVAVDFSVTSTTADTAFSNRGGFVINCNHGGGHCGGAALASSMWEFFKAHPYGVDPHPWSSLPAGFHRSCEIF